LVVELTAVAGPGLLEQLELLVGVEETGGDGLVCLHLELFEGVEGDRPHLGRDVFSAIAEGPDGQHRGSEAVEQGRAQPPLLDEPRRVDAGAGDEARLVGAAAASGLLPIEDPEQASLGLRAELPQLSDREGAAAGPLKGYGDGIVGGGG
jgi:hypothetical protein